MIERLQKQNILDWISGRKAIVVIGPRQVGKTTLVQALLKDVKGEILWMTGDDPETRALLDNISLAKLKVLVSKHNVIVIDEAQRITNAGLTLKLITDHLPEIKLFVTGSSSLDIAAQTKESLTGRKAEILLFPISFVEMCNHHGYLNERSLLEHRMLFGYYPEVVNSDPEKSKKILADLADGLMYKDLLSLDQIKKPSLLVKLLQAMALQLGNEVSYHEIGQLIGADSMTVEKYIDLLEQSFVVFRLSSLSRNVRNEIKKGRKIYFYDNGIRNAIIKNYQPLMLRNDTGALWENFLVSERLKRNVYSGYNHNAYFWRTTEQQEIDYVEEADGVFRAYEFKWNIRSKARFPKRFTNTYPVAETETITPDHFEAFVGLT